MNAGKLRRITFYLMVPVAILLIIEGSFYFFASGFSLIEVILCTLENTCMTFIARPTISSVNAFKNLNSNSSEFQRIFASIYVLVVIIAPILTTTAVIAGLQAYILEFWHSIRISFKDKMFIIGDGNMALKVATKYANDYNIQFMMAEGTKDKTRIPYLRSKVFAYTVDYKKIVPYLESAKIEKASCIVVNFKDYFGNYKAVSDIVEYLIKNSNDKETLLYMFDAPIVYRDVFVSLYEGLCKKYNKPDKVLKVSFIDPNERNARNFFNNPDFIEKEDKKHHIVLTGLGNYGRAVIKQLAQYMLDNQLHGTIDVFDRDLEQNISQLIYSNDSYSVIDEFKLIEPIKGARYSVEFDSSNNPIRINFYKATAGELQYSQYLESVYNESPFDEVFFCIDDISVNFDCYRIMSYYADKQENIRLYFRIGQDLTNSFDAIELTSKKLRHLPDGIPNVDLEALEKTNNK